MLVRGDRLEREALKACGTNPSLVKLLAEISPDHFDSTPPSASASIASAGASAEDFLTLRAELDARAASGGLGERTGKELLLNLRERRIRRELADADFGHMKELQVALSKVRAASDAIR